MITKKRIIAAMLAAPAAFAIAAPAQAQVTGAIGTTDPLLVVAKTKAYEAANTAIDTSFKSVYDQMNTRRTAAATEVKPMLDQVDTDKDGKLSDAEIDAAGKVPAKAAVLQRLAAAENKANQDIQRMSVPVIRAEGYAIENILQKYDAAQLTVVNAKKIGVILKPSAFVYAPDAVDLTDAIVAEIDKAAPTVSIQPPQGWQPQQRTISMQQALGEARQRAYQMAVMQQQAQQRQGQQGAAPAPAGTAPATGAKPATKPAEPR